MLFDLDVGHHVYLDVSQFFLEPRSPTGFSVFCHLVAIIHQSHRKPEGQGHCGEVNEPNVAHPLDPV